MSVRNHKGGYTQQGIMARTFKLLGHVILARIQERFNSFHAHALLVIPKIEARHYACVCGHAIVETRGGGFDCCREKGICKIYKFAQDD